MKNIILEAKNLKKIYKSPRVTAVENVSLSIEKGKTLGLVGESGCGKSTLAKLLLRLEDLDAGEIYFEGKRIDQLKSKDLKIFRKKTQIIFQEPLEALDPRMTVYEALEEPFLIHGNSGPLSVEHKIDSLLGLVGLGAPFKKRLPKTLSGGECQRVGIARALALDPSLIICDEPVTSLDVIVQAQILNLLLKLQSQMGVSYLFISHDHRVVRHMSDAILVMKDGRISGIL